MDRDVHQDMQAIRAAEQARLQEQAEASARGTETSKALTEKFQQTLSLMALEYISGDPDRLVMNSQQPPLGFSLQCKSMDPDLNPSWSLHSFDVAVTVKNDNVTVNVKDGHWEYIDGYLGNWANWTDEMRVYNDSYDDAKLRNAVDHAFLAWYKRVTNPQ